jgi:hypothetical protein
MKGAQIEITHAGALLLAESWSKSVAELFKCELNINRNVIHVTLLKGPFHLEKVGMRFMIWQGSMVNTPRESDPLWGRIMLDSELAQKAARRWLRNPDLIGKNLLGQECIDFQPEGTLMEVLSSLLESFHMALYMYFNEKRLNEKDKVAHSER